MGEKHFREIAIGRIFTDSVCAGSLLAARTVTYEMLKDGKWDCSFLEAGSWGFPELRPLFQNAGFQPPEHLLEAEVQKRGSLEVAAILHKDHSGADGLGNFMNTSCATLHAPTILLSRGCHAAGIDEKNPSVAGRMLGRGAVAYVGAPRSPTSGNTLTEVAFFDALLCEGKTLGQAMRDAFNKATTHWLDGGRMSRYCVENEMLFGDPALRFTVPSILRSLPAAAVLEGDIVTVRSPSEWEKVPILRAQLAEWKYRGDLFTYIAPGVDIETAWAGSGYDLQELYITAAIILPAGASVTSMRVLEVVEIDGEGRELAVTGNAGRWWESGKYYQHVWHDGNSSLHFRVRLLDYDMTTGHIKGQLKRARFQLCGL